MSSLFQKTLLRASRAHSARIQPTSSRQSYSILTHARRPRVAAAHQPTAAPSSHPTLFGPAPAPAPAPATGARANAGPTPAPTSLLAARMTAAAVADLAARPSANPFFAAVQLRHGPRPTMNRWSHLVRKRRVGFLARLRSKTGRRILARRLAKGRRFLSH